MTERPEYGWRARVGLIVAPASSTVEPEIVPSVPDGVAVYVSRLPGDVQEDTSVGMRARLTDYVSALPDVASRLSGLNLDVALFSHTGCSYLVGADRESELKAALEPSKARRVTTSAEVIVESLNLLDCKRLGIVSPYPDWLAELAARYWSYHGFEVSDVLRVEGPSSLYDISAEQVVAAVDRLDERKLDTVLLSGTGMPTFRAIEVLAGRALPIVSSNLCFVWWLFRKFGGKGSLPASTMLRKLLVTGSS